MSGNDRLPESGELWAEDIDRINAVHHWLVRESQNGNLRSIAHFIIHQENELSNERIARQDAEAFADAVFGDAMHIAEKNHVLKELRRRDSLTGLYERSGLKEEYEHLVSNLKRRRTDKPHLDDILIFADLDKFSEVNASVGHSGGNDLLIMVANLIQKTFRASDIMGRYGGDEFMVIMPDAPIEKALEKAEILRQGIKSIDSIRGKALNLSISLGIDKVDHSLGFEDVYARANHAMYEAKRSGRDQLVVYEENKTL
jgi:diguanylate cyclase (GGDEF)-like protein